MSVILRHSSQPGPVSRNLRYLLMVTPTTCRINKTLENRQPEGLDILKFKPWICITTKNTETNKIYWFYNISSLFFFIFWIQRDPLSPFSLLLDILYFFKSFLNFHSDSSQQNLLLVYWVFEVKLNVCDFPQQQPAWLHQTTIRESFVKERKISSFRQVPADSMVWDGATGSHRGLLVNYSRQCWFLVMKTITTNNRYFSRTCIIFYQV